MQERLSSALRLGETGTFGMVDNAAELKKKEGRFHVHPTLYATYLKRCRRAVSLLDDDRRT